MDRGSNSSTMKKIIDRFSEAKTKSKWNKFIFSKDKAEILIRALNESTYDIVPRDELTRKEIRHNFTIVKKEAVSEPEPFRKEEALERLLAVANTNMQNQIALNKKNSKESIDLVYKKKDEVILIELKYAENGGTPLYALVEGLKNFFIYKKNDQKKEFTILILAPIHYYEKFHRESSIKNFFELIEFLSKEIKIKIIVKGIRIEMNYLENAIKEMDIEEKKWTDWKPKGGDAIKAEIHAGELLKRIDAEILDALKIENWIDISLASWPKPKP